jgi:transposase InsO family protein
LFLAVVIDVLSRRVVGWSIAHQGGDSGQACIMKYQTHIFDFRGTFRP